MSVHDDGQPPSEFLVQQDLVYLPEPSDFVRQSIHEEIEEADDVEMIQRISAEELQQIKPAQKFDIKHLKAEIWKIIEHKLPTFGKQDYYTFIDLLV